MYKRQVYDRVYIWHGFRILTKVTKTSPRRRPECAKNAISRLLKFQFSILLLLFRAAPAAAEKKIVEEEEEEDRIVVLGARVHVLKSALLF